MKLEVIETPAAPWYAKGLKFTCTECGNCCTGGPGVVWISDAEIGRLAEFLKLSVEETARQYCRDIGGRYSLRENRNARGEYDCIFLKEEPVRRESRPETEYDAAVVHTRRTCAIYAVRPLQCRTWPFWDGNLASREIWDRSSQRCPGMNSGKRFTFKQIENLRTACDWPKKPPTSAEKKRGSSRKTNKRDKPRREK